MAAQMVPQSLNIYAQSASIHSGHNFGEQSRSGRAFPVKNKDNTNAGKCSTPTYYLSLLTESKKKISLHVTINLQRESQAEGSVKSNHITFCGSYIILNTAQRSGTVTRVLKRVKAPCLDIWASVKL